VDARRILWRGGRELRDDSVRTHTLRSPLQWIPFVVWGVPCTATKGASTGGPSKHQSSSTAFELKHKPTGVSAYLWRQCHKHLRHQCHMYHNRQCLHHNSTTHLASSGVSTTAPWGRQCSNPKHTYHAASRQSVFFSTDDTLRLAKYNLATWSCLQHLVTSEAALVKCQPRIFLNKTFGISPAVLLGHVFDGYEWKYGFTLWR
jgi:hypothetical protein